MSEHLARLLVDRRNAVDVDGDTAVRPDHLDRIMDDGEVSKPQEIHLEKAELLDLIFFVLVWMKSSAVSWIGTYSSPGFEQMTTPAACVPEFLESPSRSRQWSIRVRTVAFDS